MSDLVWPELPGLALCTPTRLQDVKVTTSPAGIEVRRTQQASGRWRFTLQYAVLRPTEPAPSPYSVYSETEIVRYFLDVHNGRLGTFLFDEPETEIRYRVRFEENDVELEAQEGGYYSATIKFVSVL